MPVENTSPDRQEMKLVCSMVWLRGSLLGGATGFFRLAVQQRNTVRVTGI